jgi:signal peptidase II
MWPYFLAIAVLAADQLSKWWIIRIVRLPEIGSVELLPWLSFTWVENRGLSMGLLPMGSDAGRWVLTALTAGIAVVVAIWLGRERSTRGRFALALVLGGAIGNIVDRLRFGYVADFVHFHLGTWSFYVFNVADAGISIGVAILLLASLAQPGARVEESVHDR